MVLRLERLINLFLAQKRLTGQMDGLLLCTCAKKDLKLSRRIDAKLASQNTLDLFACNYSALPR